MIDSPDRKHLERRIELAWQGLNAGDEAFGSVLGSTDRMPTTRKPPANSHQRRPQADPIIRRST